MMRAEALAPRRQVGLAMEVILALIASSLVLVAVPAFRGIDSLSPAGGSSGRSSQVLESLAGAPMAFVPNRGQSARGIGYSVQGSETSLYFTDAGVTYSLTDGNRADGRWIVSHEFLGANPHPRIEGSGRTGGIVSYFKGQESEWVTGIPTFTTLRYQDVWPGIDVVYRGTAGSLKYNVVVGPGADPADVALAYRGARSVRLTSGGALAIGTPEGAFTDTAPLTYQVADGRRVGVASAYRSTGAGSGFSYGFDLGSYDPSRKLVIDPTVIVYSGFIAGDVSGGDGNGIAVDGSGNAYVTGETRVDEDDDGFGGFPVKVGPDLTFNGGIQDAFVAKVKAVPTHDPGPPEVLGFDYVGYIGGASTDIGRGIAVDDSGNAYVTGETFSSEATFPVLNGPDLTYAGGSSGFVAKVNADGMSLGYAGYIGGGGEIGHGIAVDGAGAAYVTGQTGSSAASLGATVGPDTSPNGSIDAFVAKVNADQVGDPGFAYLGYIGGSDGSFGIDVGRGIAVDGSGNAYVAGWTESTEATFPDGDGFGAVPGPDQDYNGGTEDAFVAKVASNGMSLAYAGYVGGGAVDVGTGIAVDGSSNAYLTGYTTSTETTFPDGDPDTNDDFAGVPGPDQTFNGGDDAFVAKVNVGGTALDYAGYIGGNTTDEGYGIAVDGDGNAYVVGSTRSTETTFPETDGPDLTHNGDLDVFVAKVKADPTFDPGPPEVLGFDYAGYIGGVGAENGFGIAVDGSGNAYVTGWASTTDFPAVVGPDTTKPATSHDPFVTKISDDSTLPTDPALASPSHDTGVASNDNTVDITWMGASDAGSGVDGFSFEWDNSPGTTPDTTKDAEEGAPVGSGATTSDPLLDDDHYFHLRTRDNAGNWTSTVHMGPFVIDATPPIDPALASPSHAVNVASNDNTVDITWSGASDAGSGVDGFSFEWDTSPGTLPDMVKDAEETATGTTSNPLPDGTDHWFHLRTRDNAGNWTATVHMGPFVIDTGGGGGGGGAPPPPPDDDLDDDGILDPIDNCVTTPNPDQSDADGDGIGDACDETPPPPPDDDLDDDGILDPIDNCVTTPNPDQSDAYGDGIGDACDGTPLVPAPPCLNPTIVGTLASELIVGTPGDDVILDPGGDNVVRGGGGNDLICTGPGDDVIRTKGGNDVVHAGDGDNTVRVGRGADNVTARSGRDAIRGGAGNDHISTGSGNDRINGGRDIDTCKPGPGIDVVVNCEN